MTQQNPSIRHAAKAVRRLAAAGVIAIGGIVAIGATTTAETSVTATPPANMEPVKPMRFMDTRAGQKTIDGKNQGEGPIPANTEYKLNVAGREGIPADATAVMLNVTAIQASAPGHVTLYPCGVTLPNASNVNFLTSKVTPNAVFVKIGTNGQVCINSLAKTDVAIDVNAYVPKDGSPIPLTPARLMDSRTGQTTTDGKHVGEGPMMPNVERKLEVNGRGSVPADASAVLLNVTTAAPGARGHITVYPCGTTKPNASNANYLPNETVANLVLVKVGTEGDNAGKVCFSSFAKTDLVVDVDGYVPTGGGPLAVQPARLYESRSEFPTVDGKQEHTGRVKANTEIKVDVAGRGGVAATAKAAMLNVTAIQGSAPGHVTVYPCGEALPVASSVNYAPNQARANAVLAKIGTNGQVCVQALTEIDLVVDVNAYVEGDSVSCPDDSTTTTMNDSTTTTTNDSTTTSTASTTTTTSLPISTTSSTTGVADTSTSTSSSSTTSTTINPLCTTTTSTGPTTSTSGPTTSTSGPTTSTSGPTTTTSTTAVETTTSTTIASGS